MAVDLPDLGSNQHEINGSHQLRQFFGGEPTKAPIQWHYFSDADTESDFGQVTFYDARAKSSARTGRSEWRLYYTGHFLMVANVGDLLLLTRTQNGELHGLIFSHGTGVYEAALQLFEIEQIAGIFSNLDDSKLQSSVEFTRGRILAQLEIEYEERTPRDITRIVSEHAKLPDTLSMSRLAMELDGTAAAHPDDALVSWIETEEKLFKAFERREALETIRRGFDDIQPFLDLALSLLNRRKARMGYALQNHLARLFLEHGLSFVPQAPVDGKPDFLFPGVKPYEDQDYPEELLTMLAAKSTLRERWKDVLAQAVRIRPKHVCTIDATLSRNLVKEMAKHGLALVIPQSLHSRYAEAAEPLLSIKAYLTLIAERQERAISKGLIARPVLRVAEPKTPPYQPRE